MRHIFITLSRNLNHLQFYFEDLCKSSHILVKDSSTRIFKTNDTVAFDVCVVLRVFPEYHEKRKCFPQLKKQRAWWKHDCHHREVLWVFIEARNLFVTFVWVPGVLVLAVGKQIDTFLAHNDTCFAQPLFKATS